ncbi:MAG TPA: chromate transporter [Pyrinomonadaceae bacterium]|jgi:chromate transporter|nr:chromate transporter [Pyrinomonadaceae bacterium]
MRTRVRYGRREIERISRTATLGGLFLSFFKIGLVGFGGGLAVISQIRALVVNQRRWLTDQEFAEGFALAQSLPGTSAGNAATYIGLKLRGWRGACVSMAGFILPSMLMMIVLAILYRHLRVLPDTDRLFHGLNAAVVALILVTAWRIGRNTLNKKWQWALAVIACLTVSLFSATVLEVVIAAGVVGIFIDSFAEKRWKRWRAARTPTSRRRERIASRMIARRRERRNSERKQEFVGGYLMRAIAEERVQRATLIEEDESHDNEDGDNGSQPPSKKSLRSVGVLGVSMPVLAKLGLLFALSTVFLRMGAATFGGGFVMIPLMEAEVVNSHHWLTRQEFADATALGQITPGPVLIAATFIGYRVAGTLGALVATISIFLPAFLMTIAAGASLRRFRTNEIVQSFLRGVTPAVVGLLVAAAVSIGRAGINGWIGVSITILALLVLVRFRINAFWVILGAGVLRFLIGFILL